MTAGCYVCPPVVGESLLATDDASPESVHTEFDTDADADADAVQRPWIAEVFAVKQTACCERGLDSNAWLADAWSKVEDGRVWHY